MDTIKFVKTKDVKTPTRAYGTSIGYDFYIPNDVEWQFKKIPPQGMVKIPSGIRVEVPEGYAMIAHSRSGKGSRGLIVGATVVDPGYIGEVHLSVINTGSEAYSIERGKSLVQFIFIKVELPQFVEVKEIEDESERGSKGFGSSDSNQEPSRG